ncbi:MAG: acetate--CoA ligase family protein [Desulfococcaceae bacterium]
MTDPLQALLAPRSIAVVGATNTPGRVGRIIFQQLRKSGLPLYPVTNREPDVLGIVACPDVGCLSPEVDLAVIAVNARQSVEAAEACAKAGVPAVVVVAGGFGETGEEGRALEDRLAALPEKYGTRVLGPNTLGLFIPHIGIDTLFVEHGDRALAGGGGVAFISQSGSVGVEALGLASNTGFGMRAFVGLGNKCDLDEVDFLSAFADDPGALCLALYVESFADGRAFLEAARAASEKKPVVVLKAGRSAAGAEAVGSHTGRLAGSDRVVAGVFRQFGVQRVYDDEALCDAAKALSGLPIPAGDRVAILTPAGGYGVMGADHVELSPGPARLRMARLSPETEERIRAVTPAFASPHNPVDLTASANDRMVGAALDALLADPGVDIVICTAFFAPPAITDHMIDEIADRVAGSSKPVIVFTQYGPYTDDHLGRFHEKGVVGFPSIARAIRAARFLAERAEILRKRKTEKPSGAECPESIPSESPQMDRRSAEKNRCVSPDIAGWLETLTIPGRPDEFEAKALLAEFGIPIPQGRRFQSGEEPGTGDLRPPLVAKVCDPAVIHKSEGGGVILGLGGEGLPEAVHKIRARFPGSAVLVEEMADFDGPEFIIGTLQDPAFGPAVMVGAGGVLTELYEDVAFRLAPLRKAEALRMLGELRTAPLFSGYRGATLDADGLADLLVRVSQLALALGDRLGQLDLNPVVFSDGKWMALDAALVPAGATR